MNWSGGGFSNYALGDLASDIRTAMADAAVPPTERVHLVGHAFGNRVVRTFATLYPERTAGLVLVAAGDKTDNMPADVARSLRLSTLGFIPWPLRGESVSKVFFAAGIETPEYWKRGWSSWGAIGQARAAKANGSSSFNAGGKGPMLVLQAQDDVIAPPKDAGELLKANYGARVTLVPVQPAGHALLPEQPDTIATAIISFLRKYPAK
jgi:pimeloyl-ACP methyl ester carboxylesterase